MRLQDHQPCNREVKFLGNTGGSRIPLQEQRGCTMSPATVNGLPLCSYLIIRKSTSFLINVFYYPLFIFPTSNGQTTYISILFCLLWVVLLLGTEIVGYSIRRTRFIPISIYINAVSRWSVQSSSSERTSYWNLLGDGDGAALHLRSSIIRHSMANFSGQAQNGMNTTIEICALQGSTRRRRERLCGGVSRSREHDDGIAELWTETMRRCVCE